MNQVGNSQSRGDLVLKIIAFFFIVIGIKLGYKQTIQHKNYLAMARNQYESNVTYEAKRGKILAQDKGLNNSMQNGQDTFYPLAINVERFQIMVVPKNLIDPKDVAEKIGKILEIPTGELLPGFTSGKPYLPPVKRGVDKPVADKVKELDLAGVMVTPEQRRLYPENTLAAQILGFVNLEGKANYGIEQHYDDVLRGTKGQLVGMKDTSGQLVKIQKNLSGQNGVDIVLTLDHTVQYMVEQKLQAAIERYKADSGSVVIMNPYNGAILAAASLPSYDPNKYFEIKDYQNFNDPISNGSWEPGSIMKPLVMAMAVNDGKVEPDTKDTFSNMVKVDGYEIHTAQDKAFGTETMTQVLENSDNVAMVWLGEKIGNETMGKYFEKLNFGQISGIDVENESTGKVLPYNNWRNVERATMSFGQGISVTPIQMLVGFAAIANGGDVVVPRLVDKVIDSKNNKVTVEPRLLRKDVFSDETTQKITGMMVSVVERGHGKLAGVKDFKVAGKTGTAQIPNPAGGYFEKEHIGSFVGFAPADQPKFVMLVKLDRPKNVEFAESSAAPLFGEIADWLLKHYFI